MMQKKIVCVMFLIGFLVMDYGVLSVQQLHAQQLDGDTQNIYELNDIITLPQIFHVGDMVELRAHITIDPNVRLSAPATPPLSPDLVIDTIYVRAGTQGYSLLIEFTPYNVGMLSFPPIDLGGITLSNFNVYVNSIVEEDRGTFTLLLNQLLFPSTRVILVIMVLLVVIFPIAIVALRRPVMRYVRFIYKKYKDNKYYRSIIRNIQRISYNLNEMNGRQFYFDLIDYFRKYLTYRLQVDFSVATTKETIVLLESHQIAKEYIENIKGVFYHSDLVKFAHRPVPVSMRAEHLRAVNEFMHRVDALTMEKEKEKEKERRRRDVIPQ